MVTLGRPAKGFGGAVELDFVGSWADRRDPELGCMVQKGPKPGGAEQCYGLCFSNDLRSCFGRFGFRLSDFIVEHRDRNDCVSAGGILARFRGLRRTKN